jgi:hypothetical protein
MRVVVVVDCNQSINRIYNKHSSSLDLAVAQMQFGSLPREDW